MLNKNNFMLSEMAHVSIEGIMDEDVKVESISYIPDANKMEMKVTLRDFFSKDLNTYNKPEMHEDEITIRGNVFTDIDKAINYLKKLKTLKQFMEPLRKPKYKVGDKFFFENLSTIEIPFKNGKGIQKRWMKIPLSNVVGEIKNVFEYDNSSDTKYKVDIEGYESKNVGYIILTDYILENYGKKINR